MLRKKTRYKMFRKNGCLLQEKSSEKMNWYKVTTRCKKQFMQEHFIQNEYELENVVENSMLLKSTSIVAYLLVHDW